MASLGVAGWASLIGTSVSVYSAVESGNVQKENLAIAGRAEETNAKNAEIERKRRLVQSLSLANVKAGASGITSGTGSSAQALQLEDISRKDLDTQTAQSNLSQRKTMLRSNAKTAETSSLLSASGEIASSVGRYKNRGKA